LTLSASGSKSQPGSGVPAAAFANKSANLVDAPRVTFLQKSAPSAALKVAGSHSSNMTTGAKFGCLLSYAAPAKIRLPASTPNLAKAILVIIFLPSCCGNRSGQFDGPQSMECILRQALICIHSPRLKFALNLHENRKMKTANSQ